MKILVLGNQGQVARSLAALAAPGLDIVCIGRPELDLTDRDSIVRAIAARRPDIVVNAAAYTQVDKAESERDLAFAVNAAGSGNAAGAAAEAGLPFVHISTDYVFPGDSSTPYREDDPVGPLSVYGRSKLDGERAVAEANADHAIFRTAWVYSPYGANFMRTMLRLAADRPQLRVVGDQIGTPTYAPDIAEALVAVSRRMVEAPSDASLRGVFHLVAEGTASWAEFAAEIFRVSAARGGPAPQVVPITTDEYPTPVRRPAFSVLDTGRLKAAYGLVLPQWQTGVARCMDALDAAS